MSGHLTRLLAMLVFSVAVSGFSVQNATSVSNQESVVLTKLFQPVYPPLAKQTHITGDVGLALEVRTNGSLESVDVVSGHPLLKQAALDSAKRSQFACKNCGDGMRSFQMLYSFQLGPTRYCAATSETSKSNEKEEPYPRVTESQNHVTVIDQPVGTCDVAIDHRKVRSAKCLYLWKCDLQ
jgi:TonB family protein